MRSYVQQKELTESKSAGEIHNPQANHPYVPPFKMIRNALGLEARDLSAGKSVSIPSEFFKALMRCVIAQGFFDERWYLETYPDVEAAIQNGKISNALEHYTTAGYYEDRSPGPCFVDRNWYERYYGDLSRALNDGTIADSAEHFHQTGYFEGRAATADQLAAVASWRRILNAA